MIEYKPLESVPGVTVYLDGRKVGYIRKENGVNPGWRYFPASTPRKGGDIFPTLEACKASLEQE